MTVIGVVKRVKAGNIEERHVLVETITAPDSDVTVPAGGTANIVVNIAGESPRDIAYAGIESVSGLPSGVYIAGISVDKSAKTLTITLYNSGASDVTISARSLVITVVAIS